MPLLGNRGAVAPREIAKASKAAAPPAAKLPATPVRLPRATPVLQQHPVEANWKRFAAQTKTEAKAKAKPPSGPGLFSLATIENPGRVITQGYKNLASASGIDALNYLGKLPAEAVNIPAQAVATAYHTGHAFGEARKGHPAELEQIGHELLHQSPVARLFKGEVSQAVKLAGEHPLNTALEVGGTASAFDRALGAIDRGNLTGYKAEGATNISRPPRPLPENMAPEGGVAVPQKPYDKGFVRAKLQKASELKPVSVSKGESALRHSFDQHESETLLATRQDRAKVDSEYGKLLKIPGREAVGHFASGLLADPHVLSKDGTPLFRTQLSDAIDHFSRTPAEELPHSAFFRNEVVAHLKELAAHPTEHFTQAYKVAQDIAAKKRGLEPELKQHHIYTGDTMRIAKLIKPFQFHFRGQQPFVEPTVNVGESPFRLGGPDGKVVPVDEVARKLEAKGVHENQLSFVSTRPFQTEAQARVSGFKQGGRRESSGRLSGAAYVRGHFDPAPEALQRQHLTTQNAINAARATVERARRFYFKNTDLAKMIDGQLAKRTDLPAEQGAAIQRTAHELRGQKNLYFHDQAGRSAMDQARTTQALLKELGVETRPVRVAHQYATAAYRQGLAANLAKQDVADMQDRLEPPQGESHLPSAIPGPHDDASAGPIALVHPAVEAKIKQYEANLGRAHLLSMPGSVWRKANVALSPRHPTGVAGEIGIRAAANNIGVVSFMRGTRVGDFLHGYAAQHPASAVKAGMQRLDAQTGGTQAGYALSQGKHIPISQLEKTWLGRPRAILRGKDATTGQRTSLSTLDWWLKGETHKLTGLPLRAIRGVVKATSKTTDTILAVERKAFEHPPQIAGMGKHYAEEYKRITGKRMKVIGAMSDVEKSFLRGQLDPKAIDHFANQAVQYWGEWKNSSPKFRSAQAVSPFLRWYTNALRFIYQTMPKDHPVQTGIIAALESATREQRQAEGQEYNPDFGLPKGKLPDYQQGSVPNFLPGVLAGGVKGGRLGQEYYTPAGAVSQGPFETALGALAPYASGLYNTLQGIDPITRRPIEEVNPQTGRKEPVTAQGKLALLGAISGLESFVPPFRWAQEIGSGKTPGYVFRPFRTEKEHKVGPKAKTSGLGGSLGGSLGGGLGGGLK